MTESIGDARVVVSKAGEVGLKIIEFEYPHKIFNLHQIGYYFTIQRGPGDKTVAHLCSL